VLVDLLDYQHDNLYAGVLMAFTWKMLHRLLLDKLQEEILLADCMTVVAVFS
jgi:hypothetical protein